MNAINTDINFYEVIATYDINDNKYPPFKVILKQNIVNKREFEIIFPVNTNGDQFNVLEHPFCQKFVLPWVNEPVNVQKKNIDKMSPAVILDFLEIKRTRDIKAHGR